MFCKKNCLHYGTNHKTNVQIRIVYLDMEEPKSMGNNQTQICEGSNFNCSKLGEGIHVHVDISNLVV
jgi:hypothetical protein